MTNMKISIIVPVFNAAKYLDECLNSLINQTYKHLEIICVNDGSTDESILILKKFAAKDSRIKIFDKKNSGISKARNQGIDIATGEYIMFVDSDDWLELNNCEVAISEALKNNADVIFWSYVREFPQESKRKVIFKEDYILFSEKDVKRRLHRRFCGLLKEEMNNPENADAIVPVWAKLYKASLIKDNKIKFVDLSIIGTLEDALFNYQLFNFVSKAVFLNKFFYHYRKDNASSLTTIYKPMLYEQWQNLFDLMEADIKKFNLEDFYVESLNNRIAFSIIGLGINELSNEQSYISQLKSLKKILSNKRYKQAFKNFEIKFLPLHWKVFFLSAKYNITLLLYLMIKLMHIKIRK